MKNDKSNGFLSSNNLRDSLDSIIARYEAGLSFLEEAQYDEARSCLESILQDEPQYALAHFGLGCVFIGAGETKRAVEEWNKCLEIDSTIGEAHYALAWYYYETNELDLGYEHVNKAQESSASLEFVKGFFSVLSIKEDKIEIDEIVEDKVSIVKRKRIINFVTENVWDLIYSFFLIIISLYFGNRFFRFEFLNTGYPDWIYHAYRIKSLLEYGFLTWSNDWVGGFPIWQSYQFIPHLVTAIVSVVGNISVTKAMMFLTGIQFICVRIFSYFLIRKVGYSSEGAFLSSLLTFAINVYYGPVSDFSLLWGVTVFPLMILFSYNMKPKTGRIYLYAILIGVCFYVHPILAIMSGFMFIMKYAITQTYTFREILQVVGISALVSSFYWFPLIFGDKPAYTDPWVLSTAWQRVNMPKYLFGLSYSVIIVLIIALAFIYYKLLDHWTVFLLISVSILSVVVLLSYMGWIPSILNIVMPTRWMVFIGLLICYLSAPILDRLRERNYFKVILIAVVCIIILESNYITAKFMPSALNELSSPEVDWVVDNPTLLDYSDKVLVDNYPSMSYFAFGSVRTTGHYFIQGAYDLLTSPLKWLFFSTEATAPVSTGNFSIVEDFLKITGTSHVIISDSFLITRALSMGGIFEGRLNLMDERGNLKVFSVPWEPIQGFYTDIAGKESLRFPDIKYTTYDEVRLRDRLVRNFNEVMFGDRSRSVPVSFPSQTEIDVTIDDCESGNYLVVFAQYDGSWRATVNGENIQVERNGPNYIGLDISGYSGDLDIRLVHRMHWTWMFGIIISIFGLGIGRHFAQKRE